MKFGGKIRPKRISEIHELKNEGNSAEQIIERLGNPKELAISYLSDNITKDKKFSIKKMSAVIAFYRLAGFTGMIILPITSIIAVTFMLCSIICPAAGIIKFSAHLLGYEIEEIQFVVGSFSANAITFLPLSIITGILCLVIGILFWRITVFAVRTIGNVKLKMAV